MQICYNEYDISRKENFMSVSYVSNSSMHPILYPKMSYSDFMGIVDSADFACLNREEDNYVLIYVSKGNFFCKQNKQDFVLKSGDYLFLNKNILHSYYFDKKIPSEIYWIHINGEVAKSIIAQIEEISTLPYIDKNPEIFTLLQQCISMHKEMRENPFFLAGQINTLLYTVLGDAYKESQKALISAEELDFRNRFENALGKIDLKELTLDKLAWQMQMSKYYFSHLFRRYYKTSPIKHINGTKLLHAKQFLLHSDLKISAIAAQCGFSSPSYFATAFRKEFSVTPEEYRKLNKNLTKSLKKGRSL